MATVAMHLPNEIISNVMEQLDDIETLRAVAKSGSRLQSLAEPVLYRHIFHRTGGQAGNLLKTIEQRPERAKYIQTIDSRCKWHKREGLISLAPILDQTHNVRELTIESPYCKHSSMREADVWRQTMHHLLHPLCKEGGFRKLRHLTLHLSGCPRYWIINKHLAPILAHPTLHSMTLSCAEIHEDEILCIKDVGKLPLKKLTLVECNITLEALQILLSLPRDLERLDLGENCSHQWLNTRDFRFGNEVNMTQLCSSDVKAFFEALEQQKHSLRTLTYTVRGPSKAGTRLPSSCKGLSEFYLLENVTLDGYCPYFETTLSTARTAPPNLVSLVAKGDMFRLQCAPGLSLMDDYQGQVGWTIMVAGFADHLKSVRIVSSRTFTNISNNHREAVTRLGQAFSDRGVSMRLFKRTFHRNIPPFLYGEQEYREELVYDSIEGFSRAIGSIGDREDDDINF